MPISLKTGRVLAAAAALLLLAACGGEYTPRTGDLLAGPAAGLGAYPAE